ncbi:MAG: dihydropteroate synthase [Actinomycetes bacterium]
MQWRLGSRTFDGEQTVVMAIVNRTPDSFYDAGATFTDGAAMAAVDRAVADGAGIVDIGGVKAGPGDPVDATEEIRRVVPFVEAVRKAHPSLVISVDTWRAEVARAVCDVGADLLNDAWGGFDPALAGVAARYGVGVVCTHTGGATPRTRPFRVTYADPTTEVATWMQREARRCLDAGVRADGLLVDPGHDFGKNTRHSLEITRNLDRLADLGWPLLVSLSNKDFVGETLDRPVDQRLSGTLAATAISAWLGACVFRAHDVRQTREVLDLVASVQDRRPPAVARRGLA